MSKNFQLAVEKICEKDPRYKYDAYVFVMEGLAFTQKKFRRTKHVSGEELLEGLRELLLEKFGPMTLRVLEHWGIQGTEDFGNIVFNLVDNKVLSKTEEDTIESFREGYDFHEAFSEGYRKKLLEDIRQMRAT